MATILLIDDDRSLTELLAEYLIDQGHEVQVALNGDAGLRSFFAFHPDLVVLDVTMPQRDGWQTLERIRELAATPVIMLTARNEEANVLRGFKLGADDYVTKPFSFAELAARIGSILSRLQRQHDQETPGDDASELRAGDLVVDLLVRRVWRNREMIHLTPTEFRLLTTLMRHEGEVLEPRQLVREVWGEQYLNDEGYVRRYIWHLRNKIEPDPSNPRYIHNEHGYGYRFAVESGD